MSAIAVATFALKRSAAAYNALSHESIIFALASSSFS
jgi:hypothetical protein